MNKLWQKIGTFVYWMTWPGIWLMLRGSKRTRIIIASGSKILVVKPWLGNGKWSLPGGGIKKNEKPFQSLVRELEEEVGLKIKKQNCKIVSKNTYKQDGLTFKYYLFSCKQNEQKKIIRKSLEIADAKWVNWHELSVRSANNDVINAIKTL
ncbi:NUDIX hydrolase [Candidatus Saccharibacteria bacterium]|nr:NUDIX hydrolase [Candidatus Saccharibacteria bacterium]